MFSESITTSLMKGWLETANPPRLLTWGMKILCHPWAVPPDHPARPAPPPRDSLKQKCQSSSYHFHMTWTRNQNTPDNTPDCVLTEAALIKTVCDLPFFSFLFLVRLEQTFIPRRRGAEIESESNNTTVSFSQWEKQTYYSALRSTDTHDTDR